jgi:hypothetical protein
MKFWELISLFREEIEVLEKGLAEKKWHEFQDMFYDYDFLIQSSGRDLLDKIVPNELIMKLATQSQQLFSLDTKERILRKNLNTQGLINNEVLSMLFVIENYGYEALDELEQHGSFKIPV